MESTIPASQKTNSSSFHNFIFFLYAKVAAFLYMYNSFSWISFSSNEKKAYDDLILGLSLFFHGLNAFCHRW